MTTKSKLAFLVLILILALPFILACDKGPTVVNTANDAVNAAEQVQQGLNALDTVNDKVFPDNANAQTMCIYTYQDGHSEQRPC